MDSGAAPRGRRIDDIVRSPADGLDRVEVEKWRWFGSTIVWERFLENLPTIFVPIFVILFFAVVSGLFFFYEGRWQLSAVILLLASIAIGVLIYVYARWTKRCNREG